MRRRKTNEMVGIATEGIAREGRARERCVQFTTYLITRKVFDSTLR